ncbi:hypothetical protein [Rhodococcus sp. 27YEA15]|uniref:hypothetical protein n=1 Tax=Rhodococcus sp. 27YEA15 TaxID=3156259 RepID=UPI003C7A4F83
MDSLTFARAAIVDFAAVTDLPVRDSAKCACASATAYAFSGLMRRRAHKALPAAVVV